MNLNGEKGERRLVLTLNISDSVGSAAMSNHSIPSMPMETPNWTGPVLLNMLVLAEKVILTPILLDTENWPCILPLVLIELSRPYSLIYSFCPTMASNDMPFLNCVNMVRFLFTFDKYPNMKAVSPTRGV